MLPEGKRVQLAESIPIPWAFHRGDDRAVGALEAVGAKVDPRLTMSVDVPGVGAVRRWFAVLDNILARPGEGTKLRKALDPLLRTSDAELAERLERGGLPFTPVNQRVVHRLIGSLHDLRVHLPWAFQPMNLDLAMRVAEVHREDELPFRVFYNQAIRIRTTNLVRRGAVELAGVFYLPVDGSAGGTWRPPAAGKIDPMVALVLEADAKI